MPEDNTLITDDERERALARLRDAAIEGRLTLDEFSERSDTVLAARTHAQLTPVLQDLPALPAPAPHRSPVRQVLAVLGNNKHAGRMRLADRAMAVSVLGSCEIDLRQAEIVGEDVTISATALLGEVKIIVPEGTDVEMNGLAVLGEKTCDPGDAPPRPGSPRIRVEALAVLGNVKVEARGRRT